MVTGQITTAFANGLFMSLVLIVAIGAQNAYVLRQGLRREHVSAVVLFCAVSDAVLITAGVAGMAQALEGRPAVATVLAGLGALFLGAYGLRALWRSRQAAALHAVPQGASLSRAAVLAQAAGFTLLNPHVYLDTVLLVGSTGAQYGGSLKAWFVAGSALASALWFSALGFGARWLAPVFARPRAWQMLDALIGGTMLVLAALLARRALLGA
jgi:L-lysine exporter family protein LysE/ArgO